MAARAKILFKLWLFAHTFLMSYNRVCKPAAAHDEDDQSDKSYIFSTDSDSVSARVRGFGEFCGLHFYPE